MFTPNTLAFRKWSFKEASATGETPEGCAPCFINCAKVPDIFQSGSISA